MPTYEYKCFSCGRDFEAFQRISDSPLSSCPACSSDNVKRLISATAFHLKGSGWYKTDYGSSGTSASSTSKEEKNTGTTETKAETTPATSSSDTSSSSTPTTSKTDSGTSSAVAG